MEISIEPDGPGRYIIGCPSAMDWNTHLNLVDSLKSAVAGREVSGIIVDLVNVRYISSAGLGAIFSLRRYAGQVGASIAVARPNLTIARMLKTVNLGDLVPITDGLEQARAELASSTDPD